MARHSVWTRAKHSDGLERPRFWEPLAAQKNRGVAPAPQTGKGSVCEVFRPRPVTVEKAPKESQDGSLDLKSSDRHIAYTSEACHEQ